MSKTSCKICILWQDTLTRNYFIGGSKPIQRQLLVERWLFTSCHEWI